MSGRSGKRKPAQQAIIRYTRSRNTPVEVLDFVGERNRYKFYQRIKIGSETLALSTFFPVKIWPETPTLNLAELSAIYTHTNQEPLCMLKLYFLPENTPDGRSSQHGDDELISLNEPIIVRARDLESWLVNESEWQWGWKSPVHNPDVTVHSSAFSRKDYFETGKGSNKLCSPDISKAKILVLTFDRYVRLRTAITRISVMGQREALRLISDPTTLANGGMNLAKDCRVLFSRAEFEYSDLEEHKHVCNHLIPKIKGISRKVQEKRDKSKTCNGTTSDDESSTKTNSPEPPTISTDLDPVSIMKAPIDNLSVTTNNPSQTEIICDSFSFSPESISSSELNKTNLVHSIKRTKNVKGQNIKKKVEKTDEYSANISPTEEESRQAALEILINAGYKVTEGGISATLVPPPATCRSDLMETNSTRNTNSVGVHKIQVNLTSKQPRSRNTTADRISTTMKNSRNSKQSQGRQMNRSTTVVSLPIRVPHPHFVRRTTISSSITSQAIRSESTFYSSPFKSDSSRVSEDPSKIRNSILSAAVTPHGKSRLTKQRSHTTADIAIDLSVTKVLDLRVKQQPVIHQGRVSEGLEIQCATRADNDIRGDSRKSGSASGQTSSQSRHETVAEMQDIWRPYPVLGSGYSTGPVAHIGLSHESYANFPGNPNSAINDVSNAVDASGFVQPNNVHFSAFRPVARRVNSWNPLSLEPQQGFTFPHFLLNGFSDPHQGHV